MSEADAELLWIDVPSDAIAIDLGTDCVPRVERLAALTGALGMNDRRRLAVSQEVLVRTLRRGDVRYAGHLLRRADDPTPRLSIAQLYAALSPTPCPSARALESISVRLGSDGGSRESGMIDLAAGRALAIAEMVELGTGSRVWHGRVVLPHRNRSFVVTVGVTTSCVRDRREYTDLLAAVAHSISFDPPAPPVGETSTDAGSARIADALDWPARV